MRLVRIFLSTSLLGVVILTTNIAKADCICRFKGGQATHGHTACVVTPHGKELARCEKVLNVASWHFLGQPCPIATLEQAPMSIVVSHS